MEAGEARVALAAVGARQRGSNAIYLLLLAILVVAGVAVALAARIIVNSLAKQELVDGAAAAGLGAAIGAVAYGGVGRTLVMRRFRRRMSNRGLAVRFSQAIKLTEEGIISQSGEITKTASWSAVTEIFKAKGYWIFLVQMEPDRVPSRGVTAAA